MKIEFNIYDVYEIQESLEAYLKILEWLPATGKEEQELKDQRLKYTKFLIDKCDDVIESMKG